MSSSRLPFGESRFIAVYSAVAGFVDTTSFVTLAGLFTAHVTGNIVLAAADVSEPETGIWPRLLMLPVFMAGVVLAGFMADRARRGNRAPAKPLLLAQSLGLAAFLAIGFWFEHRLGLQPLSSTQVALVGGIGVFTMAFQNVFMRDIAPTLPASTVMTMNLTQITLDWVRQISQPNHDRATRLARQIPALVGFLAGAALGAVCVLELGFLALILPMLAVSILAFCCPSVGES